MIIVQLVVYPLIPTSNHNLIAPFSIVLSLYILWFLHQTTTMSCAHCNGQCCISFDSYIKPQHAVVRESNAPVVYPLIPTSNHNLRNKHWKSMIVVYPLIPTSNHNLFNYIDPSLLLYILWFLHQTTTSKMKWRQPKGCISFDSYIKPQPITIKCQRTNIL